MKEGEEVVVDCEDLIAEGGVEGEGSNTPIVLTREEVDYNDVDEHHHVEPWQDVLRADVRIANDRVNNILKIRWRKRRTLFHYRGFIFIK